MIEGIIPSAGSTSVTSPASAQQPLGKDDFLQLLVAQLSGKLVDVPGNSFEHTQGETTALTYSLSKEASSTTIEVYNAAGTLVNTINGGGAAGSNLSNWNGLGSEGNPAGSGLYTFKVQATDSAGNIVTAATFTTGLVSDVLFEQGGAFR